MHPQDLEELQQANLVNNFHAFAGTPVKVGTATTAAGEITVECHDRKLGRWCYYAVLNGEPIAYCYGYPSNADGKDLFLIQSTFVTRSKRRQGVGQALYTAMAAKQKLVSDQELSDGARALWAKLSQTHQVTPRYSGFTAISLAKETTCTDHS